MDERPMRINRAGSARDAYGDFHESRDLTCGREGIARGARAQSTNDCRVLESPQRMKTHKRPAVRARKPTQRHSRPALSKFARSLLREWRRLQLPLKKERTIVGVSGGA